MPTVAPPAHAAPRWFAAPGAMRVQHVGTEREPVVVIDDASGIPAALVDAAANAPFTDATRAGSGYPGLLGPAPVAYVNALVRFVLPLIAAHFATGPVAPARARGNFSLVTTPPDALGPDGAVSITRTALHTMHAGL